MNIIINIHRYLYIIKIESYQLRIKYPHKYILIKLNQYFGLVLKRLKKPLIIYEIFTIFTNFYKKIIYLIF